MPDHPAPRFSRPFEELPSALSVAEDRGLSPQSRWDRTDFQSVAAPRQLCLPTTKVADGARSAKMAQPERSEGDERGCPRSGRREEQTRGHAPQRSHGSPISLQTSPGALVRFRLRGPGGRNCTHTTAFEARQAVCYLTPGEMACPTRVARALFRVRTAADCLLPTDAWLA